MSIHRSRRMKMNSQLPPIPKPHTHANLPHLQPLHIGGSYIDPSHTHHSHPLPYPHLTPPPTPTHHTTSHTLTLPPKPTTNTPSHTHHSHPSHTQIHCTQVAVTGLLNLAYSPATHQYLAKPYIIKGVIWTCANHRAIQHPAEERLLFMYVYLVSV